MRRKQSQYLGKMLPEQQKLTCRTWGNSTVYSARADSLERMKNDAEQWTAGYLSKSRPPRWPTWESHRSFSRILGSKTDLQNRKMKEPRVVPHRGSLAATPELENRRTRCTGDRVKNFSLPAAPPGQLGGFSKTARAKKMDSLLEHATKAIVTVGGGRGFVVHGYKGRVVITAAHCLPDMPPALSFAADYERTLDGLVGVLGETPTLMAQCLFYDPISDVAILGAPDGQSFYEEANAFDQLLESCSSLEIAGRERALQTTYILTLDRRWGRWKASAPGDWLWLEPATDAGMSGSPILSDEGKAIGIVVTGHGPNPSLDRHLPAWCWVGLGRAL
jgi:hypothetical protein